MAMASSSAFLSPPCPSPRFSTLPDCSGGVKLFQVRPLSFSRARLSTLTLGSDNSRIVAAEASADTPTMTQLESGSMPENVSTLEPKSEVDILKKNLKKLRLRKKSLVRKRHLRKKGLWPPSKVAKNKNI